MDPHKCSVTTTAGEQFDAKMFGNLAHLVWLRFGKDDDAATAAWRRMLQNSATVEDFRELRSFKDYEETQMPNIPPHALFNGVHLQTVADGLHAMWHRGQVRQILIEEAGPATFRKAGRGYKMKGECVVWCSLKKEGSRLKFSLTMKQDKKGNWKIMLRFNGETRILAQHGDFIQP